MSEPELESEDRGRFPAERPADRYVVRYGLMRLVAEFAAQGPQKLGRSTSVIVRSSRGVEWGEVLCPATERTATTWKARRASGKFCGWPTTTTPASGTTSTGRSGPSSRAAAK